MKIKRLASIAMAGVLALSLVPLAACGGDDAVAISYYDETKYETGAASATYNNRLFRKNEFTLPIADPCVLRVSDPASEEYGMFYLYGTAGSVLECFKSSDLVNWDYGGTVYAPDLSTDLGYSTQALLWAPEVIYDDADGYYYLFFTGAVASTGPERIMQAFCMRAPTPAGPFELMTNAPNEDRGNSPYTMRRSDPYALFNNEEIVKWAMSHGYSRGEEGWDYHMRQIDFHPYLDPDTGKKYLYFKIYGSTCDYLVGLEMTEWWVPDYSTLTAIAEPNRYEFGKEEINPYETGTSTNEGPWVDSHNGKYYLTFSIFGYSDSRYCVWQAVGDTPLGPFRKLTDEEGGLLVSADGGGADGISATGHHSFFDLDGKRYVVYHAYPDSSCTGDRYLCVDEIEWVTIEDRYGEPLDVMFCNGPSVGLMPRFEFASEYKNLAPEATVTANNLTEGSSAAWLNDGLMSPNSWATYRFTDVYAQEAAFGGTAEITLTFDRYKTVRAIMIYNSCLMENAFEGVKRIEMDCILADGTKFKAKIDDLKFDIDAYRNSSDEGVIRPGGSAVAEFDEMLVSAIRITVEKPRGAEKLCIPEIVVLGKDNVSAKAESIADYTDEYTFENYEVPATVVNDGITVDGVLDEAVWETQNWRHWDYQEKVGETVTLDIDVDMTSYFGENGVYFAIKCNDPTLYSVHGKNSSQNSGVELYLARAGVTSRHNAAFELDLNAHGGSRYKINRYENFTAWNSAWGHSPLYAIVVDGEINVPNGAKGYTIEFYMPFEALGIEETPEYVAGELAIVRAMSTMSSAGRMRYAFGTEYPGYSWTNPDKWERWTAEGYYEPSGS